MSRLGRPCNAVSDELYIRAQKALKEVGKNSDFGHRFKKESLEGLKVKPGRGRKPRVEKSKDEEISDIIRKNSHITIDELRVIIIKKYKVSIGRATVHCLMKRLRFSYITARPFHYKSDKLKQVQFKKKSDA